jgi:hypothetical protein
VAPKGHFGDAGPVASRPIGILSLALLLLGGCSKDAPILRADIPLEPGDRSVLISLLRPNSIEARAYAVEDQQLDAPWMLGFEAEEELRLQVLGYSQSLAQLQLPAGPLNFAETGAPSRPLPAPTRVVERRLAEATLGEWTEVGAADAEVLTRRLPLRCTNFTVSEAILPNEVRAMFLVATRDHLLMGNADGEIYLAKSDGTFTRLATLGRFYDAFAQDDGTVYLGGESGQIWRATLSRTEPWVLTATLAVTLPDGGRCCSWPVIRPAPLESSTPPPIKASTQRSVGLGPGATAKVVLAAWPGWAPGPPAACMATSSTWVACETGPWSRIRSTSTPPPVA